MRAAEGVEGVDCEDPAIALACAMETDECPAACRDNGEEDNKVVKSGDLAVTVTPATDRKAIISGNISDLDTVTLTASEKITVNSITLERFGYSTANDVASVWLEDANGNKIADEKSLSTSKDTVTLKIKKEYRDMEESNAITIVLKTSNTAKAGGTIGFKVTDVDASAKNLDLSDYNPYTYELVAYDGSSVTLSVKGNDKAYNYEEGEFYEVSRLKVKAGASVLALNGITLTNKGGNVTKTTTTGGTYDTTSCTGDSNWTAALSTDAKTCTYTSKATLSVFDLDEFVSNVKVTADGKEVSGLKYNVTKDNELVLSWDTIEIAINKDVQLIVSVAMENLDEFGKVVRLVLDEEGDINATEKKTGARIKVTSPEAMDYTWKVYTFNGSKIKFTNTKLASTIDAAQGSEDVVIAKGKVTVAEEVKLSELKFEATTGVIENMTLTIAGESYDASVSPDKKTFTFTNVFIEESGEIELSIDVVDEERASGEEVTVKLAGATSIGKSAFPTNNGRYESSREYVKSDDVSGSITISKLKVQASNGSLINKETTKRNVVVRESTDDIVVFDGTYTAKKGAVNLDNVKIAFVTGAADGNDITFKVSIDGEDVAEIDNPSAEGDDVDFDAIAVEAGDSVNVKVVARAYAESGSTVDFEYKLTLAGKDNKGNDAGEVTRTMAKIAFVPADKVTVSTSSANEAKKQDLVLASSNQVISWFVVEPDKKSNSATIDDVVFDITSLSGLLTTLNEGKTAPSDWSDPDNYFIFSIGNYTASDMEFVGTTTGVQLKISDMDAKISGKSDAKLTFTETLTKGIYTTELLKVNEDTQTNKVFKRQSVNALVKVASQTSRNGETYYTFDIDYSDDATDETISSLTLTYDIGSGATFANLTEGDNGYSAKNDKDEVRYVTRMTYTGNNELVDIVYDENQANGYPDFLKVGNERIKTFKD